MSEPAVDPQPSSSAFDRWRRKLSWMTGYGLKPTEMEERVQLQKLQLLDSQWRRCQKWKLDLMKNSPSVTFMLQHLSLAGANVTPDHLQCAPCGMTRSGGFSPDHGILLCQDGFFNKAHMEDTIVHELVHMYDHAKFKVNWNDLRHHACSEIRAASLSGDCRWGREARRGFFTFSKQHQACVRRRAVLSVRGNPSCTDEAAAERAVNEVWESCFKDTRPFDEIY